MQQTRVYIIAEAGVNHNGQMDLAEQLIESAAKSGADAVKFQTFSTRKIVHPKAVQTEYQQKKSQTTTQQELLKKLEFSEKQFLHLRDVAVQQGIQFLSTPFDLESLDFLTSMELPYVKIGSGDLTFGPLLLKAAQNQKKIFLSTGMATLDEIRNALFVLSYGYAHPSIFPSSYEEILNFSQAIDWKVLLRDKVTLFHCTSEYPAPLDEINLNVLDTFKHEFGLNVGYSDHSLGTLVPQLAVAKGAKYIEKHFTLDNELEGPDHQASLDVARFAEMVKQIRLTESILGSSEKHPTRSELKNKNLVRRGIYASVPIRKGDSYSQDKFICLRPETALSPIYLWDLIGRKSNLNLNPMDSIDE